jgi:hypothetical protein
VGKVLVANYHTTSICVWNTSLHISHTKIQLLTIYRHGTTNFVRDVILISDHSWHTFIDLYPPDKPCGSSTPRNKTGIQCLQYDKESEDDSFLGTWNLTDKESLAARELWFSSLRAVTTQALVVPVIHPNEKVRSQRWATSLQQCLIIGQRRLLRLLCINNTIIISTNIRPKLENASVAWNSIKLTDSSKLERLQRKFATLCHSIKKPF